MAKRPDAVVHRLPDGIREAARRFSEALHRFSKNMQEDLSEFGNRFDPDDPKVVETLILLAAVLGTWLVATVALQALLLPGRP
jgi:hypothetical protein